MAVSNQPKELRVIVGPSCAPSLGEGIKSRITKLSGSPFELTVCQKTDFADGERLIQIMENVRGTDVYIVQSTNSPAENFDILLQILQAAALASAGRVTAVLPYMGELRQDRKDKPRVPITAALRAQQIETAMSAVAEKHVMILHPHFPQVQGFFRIPTDILYPSRVFVDELTKLVKGDFSKVVPVGPDAGAATIADHYRKRLGTKSYAVGDKRRTSTDKSEMHGILGEVEGMIAAVFDDIIDTAGSLKGLVEALNEREVEEIYAFGTHGVLAGKAIDNLRSSGLRRVFITDSIKHEPGSLPDNLITVVSCGELLGEAIFRNNAGQSIHEIDGLFDLKNK